MANAKAPSTFPAGTALLSLGVSFVLLRVVLRFMSLPLTRGGAPQAPPLGTARVAVTTGVLGAMLAAGALASLLTEEPRTRPTPRAWQLAGLRIGIAAPVFLIVLWSLFDEAPVRLRWWALFGAVATVASSLGLGVARAKGLWLTRISLRALLLFGQLVELAWPPAHLAAMPGSTWPALLDRLGPFAELGALIGALVAAAWAVLATRRAAGAQRVVLMAPFPLITSIMLGMLVGTVHRRSATEIAHALWGVRFDLLASANHSLSVSRGELLVYLLIPQALLFAAAISFGAAGHDRGAGVRRGLGWLAVLLCGFGSLTLAGPMDPTRLAAVCLACVLLERAAVLEVEDRTAAA